MNIPLFRRLALQFSFLSKTIQNFKRVPVLFWGKYLMIKQPWSQTRFFLAI